MANRMFEEKLLSLVKNLVLIEGSFVVGASGAVGTVVGSGISSVTKLGTGTYMIKLEDKFDRYMGLIASFQAPVTGSDVNDGSFVANTTYRITAVGNTDWAAIGLPAAFTPAVGQTFVATGTGGAGTGTAKAVGDSGIVAVEVADTNVEQSVQLGVGIMVQCVNDAGSVANPAQNSVFNFSVLLRNSTLKSKNES